MDNHLPRPPPTPLAIQSFHGCLPWLPYHLPRPPPTLLAKRSFHGCKTTFHYHPQQPPNHLEFSPTTKDHLEAALAKLDAAQRRLDSQLDALIRKLPSRTSHPYSSPSLQTTQQQQQRHPPHSSLSSFPLQSQPPTTPIPTAQLPPSPPPPLQPTPSPTLTAPTTMPTPSPRPALMPQHPVPLPAPLTIAVIHLPDNSKPQVSFPSHRFLLSDLGLFPSVMFIAKVKNTELDHPFLLLFYATIDIAKWLRFRNTHLHLHIPSPILIWDFGSNLKQ
ncbi:hypothetical protein HKD37_06G015802 [Glycine soja]